MSQLSFFDVENRYAVWDAKNGPLVKINALVPWEAFRSLALIVFSVVMALTGCGSDSPPPDRETLQRMAAELEGRSFRQFAPSVDASPRRAVILDFHDGFNLWAQYAEDGHAVYEWEIIADGYRIESTADRSGIVLFPTGVTSMQQFPDSCSDCIPTLEVSVSVRDVLDEDEIAFRINDPNSALPLPFPVFGSWTRFDEDEYFE